MKKRSRLTSALIIVGLAVVAALAWWLLLGSNKPGVKQYDAAQKASQATLDAYAAYETTFNTYETGGAATANQQAYQKAYDDYRDKVATLNEAVTKLENETITKSYQTFKTQSDAFTAYTSGYTKDYATAQNVQKADCLKVDALLSGTADTYLKEYDKRVDSCQAVITSLKKSTNKGLAAYGQALTKLMQDRRTALANAQDEIKKGDQAAVQQALAAVITIKAPGVQAELTSARLKIDVIKTLQTFHNQLTEKAVAVKAAEATK